MAIIADIVHRGVVYRDIYISPHSINSDSFYTLKYLVGGKNGPPLLGMEETMRSFTFNNSRAGLSKPDGAGIAYDRSVGAWPQVYADLKAKIAAGACPWITNVRDEEVVSFPSNDALLSDFGAVGESYDDVTGDILLDVFERDEVAAAAVVQVLSATRQRHLSEQLNVEKGRLRREHMLTDVPHPREASIDRLLGLLTRRGD